MTSADEMREIMIRYFSAEKGESLLFILIGLSAIVVAVFLWRGAGPYRGMALSLAAIALIQLVVGGTVYFRTDKQVAELSDQLAGAPIVYQQAEASRMEKVMTSFRWYKWVEIILIAVGVGLVAWRRPPSRVFGIGLGLMLQAGIMLTLDIFAGRRGDDYLKKVQTTSRLPNP